MQQDPNRDWAVASDLLADSFDGVAINLFELYRARLRANQAVIEKVTFNDCRLEGPAVMLVIGGTTFDGVNFGYAGGDIRNLVLRPASPTKVIGAIPVRDCQFVNSEFFGVGFTGSETFLQRLLSLGDMQ